MGQGFGSEGVLLLRDVAGLLEQRQIDVCLDIALRARIAVPVPGAAEVAALLDDADIAHSRLAQTCAGQQAAETTANDHNLNRVVQRFAGEPWLDIGIVQVAAEVALYFDVLMVAVSAQTSVPLGAILLAQYIGIEIHSFVAGGHHFGLVVRETNSCPSKGLKLSDYSGLSSMV